MNHLPKSKKPAQCEHIKTNGTRCGSPALRQRRYCYFHFCAHDLRRRRREQPHSRLVLPLLEDANSIQMAIQQIAEAVLDERIDNKRAGLLLFACQTAASNLKNCDFEPKHLQQEQYSPAIAPIIELLLKEMNTPPEDYNFDLSKKSPVGEKELARASTA
jgi:hypothetical protein